ncbi:MAG: sigma-70 family RNA polymerase sigma factor [Pirellulaceae bacterium]
MFDESLSSTDISLLGRLQQPSTDAQAWDEFVDVYGTRIYQWCTHRQLQAADAEDVTQNVLIKIARSISKFEYDPQQTFRGWLRRITENAITDYFREVRSRDQAITPSQVSSLESEEAREDLLQRMESAFDLELLSLAMRNVQSRIDARRWQAWKLSADEGKSYKEVAQQLAMPVASVYGARYQVQKLIAAEVKRLESLN